MFLVANGSMYKKLWNDIKIKTIYSKFINMIAKQFLPTKKFLRRDHDKTLQHNSQELSTVKPFDRFSLKFNDVLLFKFTWFALKFVLSSLSLTSGSCFLHVYKEIEVYL